MNFIDRTAGHYKPMCQTKLQVLQQYIIRNYYENTAFLKEMYEYHVKCYYASMLLEVSISTKKYLYRNIVWAVHMYSIILFM